MPLTMSGLWHLHKVLAITSLSSPQATYKGNEVDGYDVRLLSCFKGMFSCEKGKYIQTSLSACLYPPIMQAAAPLDR